MTPPPLGYSGQNETVMASPRKRLIHFDRWIQALDTGLSPGAPVNNYCRASILDPQAPSDKHQATYPQPC